MHPHLDRARVAPEDFPDLGVFQILKPAQQQDFALFDWQPREPAPGREAGCGGRNAGPIENVREQA